MTLLPRLQLSDRTAGRLRQLAAQRGVGVGRVIEAILEARPDGEDTTEDDVVYRLIYVAERYGLSVGESRLFPASWVDVGGMNEAACRDLATEYIAWRRVHNEKQNRSS